MGNFFFHRILIVRSSRSRWEMVSISPMPLVHPYSLLSMCILGLLLKLETAFNISAQSARSLHIQTKLIYLKAYSQIKTPWQLYLQPVNYGIGVWFNSWLLHKGISKHCLILRLISLRLCYVNDSPDFE